MKYRYFQVHTEAVEQLLFEGAIKKEKRKFATRRFAPCLGWYTRDDKRLFRFMYDPANRIHLFKVRTERVQEVWRIYREASRRAEERLRLKSKSLPRPILPKHIHDEIEDKVFGLMDAVHELGSRGVGNIGLIFSGPPGVGKSETMRWIAHEANENYRRSSTKLGYGQLSEILQHGGELSGENNIFIDDVDVDLLRDRSGDNPHPLTSQFLSCLDGLNKTEGRVVIISTNENIDDMDPALLRAGRFDTTIEFKYPTLSLIVEYCDLHEITVDPFKFEGWSFARIDMFQCRAKIAKYRYGMDADAYYEKFVSEYGEADPTVESCS